MSANHETQAVAIDRVIYRTDLAKMLGVTSECLRLWMKAKKLPAPDVALSRKTMGWKLSTLHNAGIRLV